MKSHRFFETQYLLAALCAFGVLNVASAQIAPPTTPPLTPAQGQYEVTKRLTSERSSAKVTRTEKTMLKTGETSIDVITRYERVKDPTSPTGYRDTPVYEKRVVPVIEWSITDTQEVKARPIVQPVVVDPDGKDGPTPAFTYSVYLYHPATFIAPIPSTSNRVFTYEWRESP